MIGRLAETLPSVSVFSFYQFISILVGHFSFPQRCPR